MEILIEFATRGTVSARVQQAEKEEEVKPGGGTHTFPHGSLTAIALRRR
jgi:hypothetical protein